MRFLSSLSQAQSSVSPLAHTLQFIALTKPGLTLYAVGTAAAGTFLALHGQHVTVPVAHTVVGTALFGGGSIALNQVLERQRDARMLRTKARPLPEGRIGVGDGIVFGGTLACGGLGYLAAFTSSLAAGLGLATLILYLGVYTPLKCRTHMATLIGAVPGAIPPLIGWAAAEAEVGLVPYLLFIILFLWQIPHFLSLGWMYREDYRRGGYRILPVVDRSGVATGRLALIYSLALLPATYLPFALGIVDPLYLILISPALLIVVYSSVRFAQMRTNFFAKKLFLASLVFVPAFILALVCGVIL